MSAKRSTSTQRVLVLFAWIGLVSAIVTMHNVAVVFPASFASHTDAAPATMSHDHDDCVDHSECGDIHVSHPCVGRVMSNDDLVLDLGSALAIPAQPGRHGWTTNLGVHDTGPAPPWTVLTSADLAIWRV